VSRRSSGGTERWWQPCRSQIRQEMPIGSKARGFVRSIRRHRRDRGACTDLAAEPDGIAADRRAEAAAGLLHVAGEAEVAHAVGRLGQLAQEAARRLEGLVDVPERAGAAEAGELEPRRRVALGDRAGLVDADEEERHALGARPLQRREAVRHLLDRGAEGRGRAPRGRGAGLARGREAAVGQERGAGEVVGKADLGDGAGLFGLEAGEVERGLEQVVLLEERDLVQHLEPAGSRVRRRSDSTRRRAAGS
jgi:hypothetical protein